MIQASRATAWAKSKESPRAFLTGRYWRYAPERGVRPEIAWAQCCLETGFLKFPGAVTAEHRNMCGLKWRGATGDGPDAFAVFPTWDVGIIAHIDHLALYAALPGYPLYDTPDPKHADSLLGVGKTLTTMARKWAGDPAYEVKLRSLISEMTEGRLK